jgi:hypothetical protein
MTKPEDDLIALIRRGQRSMAESRRTLLAAAQLIDEQRRLRGQNRVLFRDVVHLTRQFATEAERQTYPPAESQS